MKILVIDDDVMILDTLAKQLRAYDFKLCDNPVEGILLAKSEDYDIIICDLKMGPIDGVEVLQEIRKTKDTPIIILTGFSESYSLEKLNFEYKLLLKPIKKEQLTNYIEEIGGEK